MPMEDAEARVVTVTAYAQGSASLTVVQDKIQAAWRDVRSTPALLQKAASALQLPVETVNKAETLPVALEVGKAGFDGSGHEAIIVVVALWLGEHIFADALIDIAKEEVQRRMRALWSFVVGDALQRQLRDEHSLGEEAKVE